MQCQCLTKTGLQCKNKANLKPGLQNDLCTLHQKCQVKVGSALAQKIEPLSVKKSPTLPAKQSPTLEAKKSSPLPAKKSSPLPKIKSPSLPKPKSPVVAPQKSPALPAPKIKILPKIPVKLLEFEIPKCYLLSYSGGRVANGDGWVFYSLKDLVQKLKDCHVDNQKVTEVEAQMTSLFAEHQALLNHAKKILMTDPTKFGGRFMTGAYSQRMDEMLITPQLKGNDLKNYAKVVLNSHTKIRKLNDEYDHGNLMAVAITFKLIDLLEKDSSLITLFAENCYDAEDTKLKSKLPYQPKSKSKSKSNINANITPTTQIITNYKKELEGRGQLALSRVNIWGPLILNHLKSKQNTISTGIGDQIQALITDLLKIEGNQKHAFEQVTSIMIQLIDETLKYPEATGLPYLLCFNMVEVENAYPKYMDNHQKLIKKMGVLLYNDYFKKYSQYPLKTSINQANSHEMIIPKGTKVYKGVSKARQDRLTDLDDYFWLGYDLVTSMAYITGLDYSAGTLGDFCQSLGVIGVFQTTEDLHLLNLSKIETIRNLMKEIKDPKILKILTESFEIVTDPLGHESIKRVSKEEEDLILVQWLCQNGYSGYTSDVINGFASELMLCHPKGKIELIDKYDWKDLGLDYCQAEFTQYKTMYDYS
jgi:hypothetical protein